ncbi:MAG: hypothetical protein WD096_12025, partial [Actinomycetota bacterium]
MLDGGRQRVEVLEHLTLRSVLAMLPLFVPPDYWERIEDEVGILMRQAVQVEEGCVQFGSMCNPMVMTAAPSAVRIAEVTRGPSSGTPSPTRGAWR